LRLLIRRTPVLGQNVEPYVALDHFGRTLYEKLSQLVSTFGEGPVYVDLMLICRHLERILRHAACVADQAADAAPMRQAG